MVDGVMAQLAQLRDLLYSMERNAGLTDLSVNERDVLLAFYANAQRDQSGEVICHTEAVRRHPTIKRLSQPTFHRTLKRLIERELILKCSDRRVGVYCIPDAAEATEMVGK